MSASEQELLDARDRHEEWLRKQLGVEGTGLGPDANGRQCLKVYYLGHLDAATQQAIRARLQDVPVCFTDLHSRAKAY